MKPSRLAALFAPLIAAACSVVGDRSGTAQVPYEVVARIGPDLEIRKYPPRVAAEATIPAGEGGSDAAFRALFAYISGANAPAEKIAMTAPVETADGRDIAMTAPVETASSAYGVRMRFFLPEDTTPETAPRPTDPRIAIIPVAGRTEAALIFSGVAGPSDALAKADEMRRRLGEAGWRTDGDVRAYFYDPPWTLPWLRRNEAAVPVVRLAEG